jgi:hypothetical protein
MNDTQTRLANLLGALAVGISDRIRLAAAEKTSMGGGGGCADRHRTHGRPVNRPAGANTEAQSSRHGSCRRSARRGWSGGTKARLNRSQSFVSAPDAGRRNREICSPGRPPSGRLCSDGPRPPDDYPILELLVEKMLASLPCDATSAMSVCRFCDQQACPACPMSKFESNGPQGKLSAPARPANLS